MSLITDLIPPQFKVAAEAVAFVVILGMFGFVATVSFMKGEQHEDMKYANASTSALVKGNQDHANVEQKVLSLPDKRLDDALGKFLYN
jgi:hypothetical protein